MSGRMFFSAVMLLSALIAPNANAEDVAPGAPGATPRWTFRRKGCSRHVNLDRF